MILEFIKDIDIQLFYLVNHEWRNFLFDVIMPFITNTKNFYLIFIIIWICLIYYGKSKTRISAWSIIIGAMFSDILSSKILKHLINRPRPFETLQNVIKMVSSAGPSFPSSHAVNSFTVATMFMLFFKNDYADDKNKITQIVKNYWVGLVAYTFAFLSAYSRVYVGVHYPFDVFCGAILGILLGYGFYQITIKIKPEVFIQKQRVKE